MAKVELKNLNNVIKAIEKVFNNTKKNRRLLREMVDIAVTRIKQQTRAGNELTVEDGKPGRKYKQPPLSEKYKKFRKAVKARGGVTQRTGKRVDPKHFRPGVSNLTFTGQLMDSIKGTINVQAGKITVFPSGKRDDGLTNKQVTEDLAERGREYLGMDEKGAQRINKVVLKELRRNIRKFNK